MLVKQIKNNILLLIGVTSWFQPSILMMSYDWLLIRIQLVVQKLLAEWLKATCCESRCVPKGSPQVRILYSNGRVNRNWYRPSLENQSAVMSCCAGSTPVSSANNMVALAQLVEHQIVVLRVTGSNPVGHPLVLNLSQHKTVCDYTRDR